jgi:hypothetical protein
MAAYRLGKPALSCCGAGCGRPTDSTPRTRLPIFGGMPPRRPKGKDTPAKLAARMSRRWRVILLRGMGQLLGEVEAADEKAAEAAAAVQFELNDEQRKRVAVQAMD